MTLRQQRLRAARTPRPWSSALAAPRRSVLTAVAEAGAERDHHREPHSSARRGARPARAPGRDAAGGAPGGTGGRRPARRRLARSEHHFAGPAARATSRRWPRRVAGDCLFFDLLYGRATAFLRGARRAGRRGSTAERCCCIRARAPSRCGRAGARHSPSCAVCCSSQNPELTSWEAAATVGPRRMCGATTGDCRSSNEHSARRVARQARADHAGPARQGDRAHRRRGERRAEHRPGRSCASSATPI